MLYVGRRITLYCSNRYRAKEKKIQRAEDLGPVVLCTGSILGKPGMKKTTSAQVLSQKF